MQILKRTKMDPAGREIHKKILVIRSWQHHTEGMLYLVRKKDGSHVYGYDDEEPVKSLEALETFIESPVQRANATAWWKAIGARLREAWETQQETLTKTRNEDHLIDPDKVKGESDLDLVLYTRMPLNPDTGETGPAEGPLSWAAWFTRRPDWWGHAETLSMKDYRYEMEQSGDPTGKKPKAEAKPEPKTGKAKPDVKAEEF